jgi:Protein of unknown function (DUF3570)
MAAARRRRAAMRHKGVAVAVIKFAKFKSKHRKLFKSRHSGRDCPNPEAMAGNANRSDESVGWVSGSVTQQSKQPDVGLRLTPNPTYLANPPHPSPLPGGEGVIRASLHALTTAALVLPGLFSPISAHAGEGDEVDFQYSHYQEGKRDITVYFSDPNTGLNGAANSKSFNPIEVDSLHGHANIVLTDRIKFSFNYTQDTWAGATPIATVPSFVSGNKTEKQNNVIKTGASPVVGAGIPLLYLDSKLNPLYKTPDFDPVSGLSIYKNDNQLSHTMATASPETRKQGDFKLGYDWENAGVSVGGGISIEDDYESHFSNLGGRLDFNQKQTTLTADLSYTNSETKATLDHDDYTYTSNVPKNQIYRDVNGVGSWKIIHGIRQDWASHFGITQVLNKDALVGADLSYTRSTGYLANPYKGVSIGFIDPDQQFDVPEGGFVVQMQAFKELRPEVRNQWNVGGRYVQYISPLDAALHFNYLFSSDDWGIQSHTFEADWVQPLGEDWSVTPRIRYYSQDAANFYTPYVISKQAFDKPTIDNNGNVVHKYYDPKKLPTNYSSDQRLSGFGTLSGGVTIAKQFAKGLTLETGFEYYTHQGGLKIGGGGEGAYTDYDYWVANAALKVNLEALALGGGAGSPGHAMHGHHNHGAHEPAGVMFAHMLPKAGDFMVGYRYMWASQSGNMLKGTNAVGDPAILTGGCGGYNCSLAPANMSMNMHMLDLMVAPTDWLTLMLMPQFVDMDMGMRKLEGVTDLGGHVAHHLQNTHETGGIGDLGMYALFKLFDNGTHHIHATAGLSAPTGDVNIQMRRSHLIDGGFIHYGMQLGSGTWDFKPSLTYTGQWDDFSWGAQANGTVRMENQNKSGYALGDMFQATAWGSYNLATWLTASVRGVYTLQGSVKGQFTGATSNTADPNVNADGTYTSILKYGSQDYPQNYGGRFWDVGFGLSAVVPSGDLAGNRVSVEWLQPVEDDVNGYQLERDGALSATWSYKF